MVISLLFYLEEWKTRLINVFRKSVFTEKTGFFHQSHGCVSHSNALDDFPGAESRQSRFEF